MYVDVGKKDWPDQFPEFLHSIFQVRTIPYLLTTVDTVQHAAASRSTASSPDVGGILRCKGRVVIASEISSKFFGRSS